MKQEYLYNIGRSEASKAWLRDIELVVENILFKDYPINSITSIDSILSKLCPGYDFNIKVIDMPEPNVFIMSIYPDIKQLEEKCSKLSSIINNPKEGYLKFSEEWSSITKWVIEIDKKILNPANRSSIVQEGFFDKFKKQTKSSKIPVDKDLISYTQFDEIYRQKIKDEHSRLLNRAKVLVKDCGLKAFTISQASDYNSYLTIKEGDVKGHTHSDGTMTIPLIDWDLYKASTRARDPEDEGVVKFWNIYYKIEKELKDSISDNSLFDIDDNGDWDGGSICLHFKKHLDRNSIVVEGVSSFNKNDYCVANGREFVAILMHEIGHVATMNNSRLINNYRKNKAKFKMVEKLMLSESYMTRKVFLPLFIHTLNFRVVTNGHLRNDLEEIKADLFIPDAYKSDLISYLDRCILSNPDAMNNIVMTDKELDSDQTVAIAFTRETLILMSKRRDILARYVQAQYKSTKSPYLKEFTKRFSQIFSGVKVDGHEGEMDIVKEGAKATEFIHELSLYEAKAVKILNEAQRISDRDLSILQVESDSVETTEDKMYVLHTIYDYLEIIQAEHRKKNKNVTEEEIDKDSRVIYLKSLRNEIIKRKILEKQYGVFVKYPVGYEG